MSHDIAVLLHALHADPADEMAWLALADGLEESGQFDRAELTRLTRRLRTLPDDEVRSAVERRVQELLAAGVQPCLPLLTNSIGMVLALIPAGTFRMGSPESEEGRSDDEGPVHEVEITRPFYLGVHPVTQEHYQRVMRTNRSHFKSVAGEDVRLFPAENVSWEDAVAFCKKLSARREEKKSGRVYRLPSEAEWEYACRGGLSSSQIFHFGNTLSSTRANFDGNYPYGQADKGPHLEPPCKVGSYRPNGFGLYDMHGNVWEWCSDWYEAEYYGKSPRQDPPGPSVGSVRVLRGGCWFNFGLVCRSADRLWDSPAFRRSNLGFRVALVPSGQSAEAEPTA